jgi:hypothetical protein
MRAIRSVYMSITEEMIHSFWVGVIVGFVFTYMP